MGAESVSFISSLLPFLDPLNNNRMGLVVKDGLTTVRYTDNIGEVQHVPLSDSGIEGPEIDVSLNGLFFVGLLKLGFTTIHIADNFSPILFDDGVGGIALLMPLGA